MNTTDTLAVNARGLVKTFGDQRAVDGIDLEVRRGEVFGVLGPNGAGKTTMLKMLATLLPIDGGTAEIFGHDVRREGHVVRQLLGVTGQYASVDENLTATENLLLFGRLQGLSRGESRRRAGHLLEQFDLTEAASQADQRLLRGHAAPARPRRQPDHPPAADLPRRADHRARPAHPRPDVGHHPRARHRGLHRPADHAVPRRGRPAGRPDRRHRPRRQGRPGHLRRAQVVGRPQHADAPPHRPRRPREGRRHRPPAGRRGRRARRPSRAGSPCRSTAASRPSTSSSPCASRASASSRSPSRSPRSTRCSWP